MSELPPIDGALLKTLRKNRGWSQHQMAEFLGCSQGRVSKFETGSEIGKPYRKLLLTLILTQPVGRYPTPPVSACTREIEDERE